MIERKIPNGSVAGGVDVDVGVFFAFLGLGKKRHGWIMMTKCQKREIKRERERARVFRPSLSRTLCKKKQGVENGD